MSIRTIVSTLVVTSVLIGAGTMVFAQEKKYGVTVVESNAQGLANAKTYTWRVSQPSPDKTIDAQIVAAIDRELATRGFTKIAAGVGDVVVTYISQQRTDVDLKTNTGTFAVGVLIVELRDVATKKPLYWVRIDQPLTGQRDNAAAVIDGAVKAMFEKYPARPGGKE